jgi:excisionase family DNA binding protein
LATTIPNSHGKKNAPGGFSASGKSGVSRSRRDARPIVLETAQGKSAVESADECLMTVEEAAERSSMSVAWWRREIQSGALPAVRLGRAVRLMEADYLAHLVVRRGRRKVRKKTNDFRA